MIRSLTTSLCTLAMLIGPNVSKSLADDDADHASLMALVKEYERAVTDADPSVLEPYLANDFSGVMVTGEEVNSFVSLQAYWDKIQGLLGEGGKYSVAVVVPEPATIVGDVAYAHGSTNDTATTSNGKTYKFQGFWTAICHRDGDSWKIVRIHGSMDAITNTFVATAVSRASMFAGGVGGLIGALSRRANWPDTRPATSSEYGGQLNGNRCHAHSAIVACRRYSPQYDRHLQAVAAVRAVDAHNSCGAGSRRGAR